MHHRWKIAALVGFFPWSTLLADSRVLFQEDFRNYREVPLATAQAGALLGNDPVWNQRAEAECRMPNAGLVFKQYLPAKPLAAELRSFDVLFNFRFASKDQKKFEFRLRRGGAGGDVILTLTGTEARLSSDGINPAVSGQKAFAAEIEPNRWRQCVLTVRDGDLKVYLLDENRVLQPVLQAKVPQLTMGGLNFFGYKDAPFSITKIVVREPDALPDYSVKRLLPLLPQEDQGWSQQPLSVPANDIFGATLRVGQGKESVRMAVNWGSGAPSLITFESLPVGGLYNDGTKSAGKPKELPDGIIRIKGLMGAKGQLDYYIRPMMRRYYTSYSYTDAYHDILRDWDVLPKASEYPVKVECRRVSGGLDIYINGRFAANLAGGAAKDVSFTLAGGAVKDAFSIADQANSDGFLPLDIAALRRAKSFVGATPSLKPGTTTINNVPMRVAAGATSADVGLTREGQGNWALEVDEYLGRSAFDGLLTEVHFSVPAAFYTRAWVLCAVDPDPAKDPILTTRLARYINNGTGNNTLADTVLRLPRGSEQPGQGITKVGTVTRSVDGKNLEVPLYLVEVPLKVGSIIDIARDSKPMDLDFFGKPGENLEQLDNSSKPDPDSTSAVQIFGVTLQKSPVSLDMVQSQPGNVFHNDEKPETTAVLRSTAPAKGKLVWRVVDVDGKQVADGATPFDFAGAGQERSINIPLKQPQLGYYELYVSVQGADGRILYEHPARFALLGQDKRKARFDSPYGTWWFDGAHNTPKDTEFAGPIMFKAGIRKVSWTNQPDSVMGKWSIFKDQVNMPFDFKDLKTAKEAAFAKGAKTMEGHLKAHPNIREVLVFHESGPGNDVPMELIGLKPPAEVIERQQRYADLFNLAGEFFRSRYPNLKLVVGNNSSAAAPVAAVFRGGGKPEYMDYIGIEAPSQVYIPEKLQEWALQGNHISRDIAKQLTGKDIPATGCYEFTYRSERDMGERQLAEWYARDILISLSNKFTRIGAGILFDTSNSYYNGLWGGSGILQRAPFGYPKQAYVAYAALTNVLDQVSDPRQIPTGSTTVYAVEFRRADGKLATALWAARGFADFNLQFEGDASVEVTDMFGRSSPQKATAGKLTVNAGTSPVYLLTDKKISSVSLTNRTFPKDAARAAQARVVAALDSAQALTIDSSNSLDTPKVYPLQLPIWQAGKFQMRQVADEQKGQAIELQLDTAANKNLSKYISEYTTLRLKQPAAVPGQPAAVGVWVKGNSNWGRVMFEIQDAEGEVWRSLGTTGWGCDILDWPGNIASNFDGWNFVALPLRDTKLFNDHSAGPLMEQWVSSGGNKRIDYPITVNGLIVEMNRTPLDLVDFKQATTTIRLRDISGINETK